LPVTPISYTNTAVLPSAYGKTDGQPRRRLQAAVLQCRDGGDLLRGFVHEDWVRELDFSSLEKVGGEYVSDDLRHRESEVVWRIRWGRERWLYVYLLLEFQSTVDPFMALRLMVYVGLLWQDLLRQKVLSPSGRLPPVLPLVLYNGDVPWRAARDVSALVEEIPGGLECYRPRLQHLLLDEKRIADAELEPLRNLAAALFRLGKDRGAEDFLRVIGALAEWLSEPGMAELHRAFRIWVQAYLRERLRGVELPEFANLMEVKSMLGQQVVPWTERWKQEGLEEGMEKGMEKALREHLLALQEILLRNIESRFGRVPDEVRRRVEALESVPELGDLIARAASAASLDELGLS
jgi:hypothetical protein